jgi:peptidylprolyl isomerase
MTRTLLAAAALLLAAGCAREARLPPGIPALDLPVRTAFAMRWVDVAHGTGAAVEPRRCLYVHYTGWLRDGTKFDSSRDTAADGTPRTPISFPQGARRVIAGWEAGFEGMSVGARRRLFIPYQLAYGELGRPPVIPPRAELIFDVEVMAVADTLPRLDPAAPAPRCAPWSEVRSEG